MPVILATYMILLLTQSTAVVNFKLLINYQHAY